MFRTGDRNYTVEKARTEWQSFCDKWGRYYRAIKRRRDDCSYKLYFTYLNYDHRIQAMIYTTNWIERLQKDFRRVTRMRGAMPNEESVLLLMGKTAMDKKSYLRQVPRIDLELKMLARKLTHTCTLSALKASRWSLTLSLCLQERNSIKNKRKLF